jgi:hypothetical protein
MSSTLPSNMPSRRNVVRSAAWTVPVVAASTAVPAYAASCGSTTYRYTLTWRTVTYGTTTTGSGSTLTKTGTASIAGPAGSSPVVATFTSTQVGTDSRTAGNLTVQANNYPNVGATGGTGLLLQHQNIVAGRNASRQVVRIQFDRPVTGLRFTITDIDANNAAGGNQSADFYDRVELTGNRTFTATGRGGGNVYVIGTGVAGSENNANEGPWRMYNNSTVASDNGDNAGNVAVTYAGAVQDITLTYWNARGTGNQAIFLGGFTFDALGC